MKTVEEWHRLMTTNPRDAGCLWNDIEAIRREGAEEMREQVVEVTIAEKEELRSRGVMNSGMVVDAVIGVIEALPLPGDKVESGKS